MHTWDGTPEIAKGCVNTQKPQETTLPGASGQSSWIQESCLLSQGGHKKYHKLSGWKQHALGVLLLGGRSLGCRCGQDPAPPAGSGEGWVACLSSLLVVLGVPWPTDASLLSSSSHGALPVFTCPSVYDTIHTGLWTPPNDLLTCRLLSLHKVMS